MIFILLKFEFTIINQYYYALLLSHNRLIVRLLHYNICDFYSLLPCIIINCSTTKKEVDLYSTSFLIIISQVYLLPCFLEGLNLTQLIQRTLQQQHLQRIQIELLLEKYPIIQFH